MGVVEADARSAVRAAPLARRCDEGPLRVIVEARGDVGDERFDVPLSFSERERRFGRRYVRVEWVTPASAIAEVSP